MKQIFFLLFIFLVPVRAYTQDFEYNASLGYLGYSSGPALSNPGLGVGMSWIVNDDEYIFVNYQFDFFLPKKTFSDLSLLEYQKQEISAEKLSTRYNMSRIGFSLYGGKYFWGKPYTQGIYVAIGFRNDYLRSKQFAFGPYNDSLYRPVYVKDTRRINPYTEIKTGDKIKTSISSLFLRIGYSYSVKQVIYRATIIPGICLMDETTQLNHESRSLLMGGEIMVSYIFESLYKRRNKILEENRSNTLYY